MSALVDAIISNALSTANAQTAAANSAAQAAITASHGYTGVIHNPVSVPLTALEPEVPAVENATLSYEAQRDQLIALLTGQLAGFFQTYYPLATDAFNPAINWLVNSITVGGTGIRPAIEAQIWQRDRDRVTAEGQRAEAQTLRDFADRGFSLPPGAAAAGLRAIREQQMTTLQGQSRDAAIKTMDVEVENVRFAVEQAVSARMQALGAAADYIRALMSAPDAAARVASINSDAKARMLGATADLYRARLQRDELALRLPMFNAETGVRAATANMQGFYQGLDARVRAAAAAADV